MPQKPLNTAVNLKTKRWIEMQRWRKRRATQHEILVDMLVCVVESLEGEQAGTQGLGWEP
jgi:hypothetical protein